MAEYLIFNITGQQLRLKSGSVIYSDTISYIGAKFRFTDEWNGLTKVLHFQKDGDSTVYDITITDDVIEPATNGMNLASGVWQFWVHGNDVSNNTVTLRITTGKVSAEVKQSGVLNGQPLPVIASSVAEQILSKAVYAEQNAVIEATATVDSTGGTPAVAVSFAQISQLGKRIVFAFTGLKGSKGEKGDPGPTAVKVGGITRDVVSFTSEPQTQLDAKVDKVTGKGLSTNDYDNTEKQKVTDSYSARHSHDNLSVLNGITSLLVGAWNGAVTWITTNGATILSHLSDAVAHITSSERTKWNGYESTITTQSTEIANLQTGKQDALPNMGLSHNDYTNADAHWVRSNSTTAKLIRSITLSEDTTNFDINVDDNGNDFALEAVVVDLQRPSSGLSLITFSNTKTYGANKYLTCYTDNGTNFRYTAEKFHGIWQMLSYYTGNGVSRTGCTNDAFIKPYTETEFDAIRCIRLRQTFPTGSQIKVYGVPKQLPATIKIMQYNIGKFNWGISGGLAADVATKIANYQQMLTEQNADIACLEEYTEYVDNQSVYNSDVSIFDGFFPYKYHYNDELAIKSKYALSNTNHFHVYGTDGSTDYFAGAFHIGTITVNGRNIAIISGYFNVNTTPEYRANGLKQLLTNLNSYDNAIVGVDLNATSAEELNSIHDRLRANGLVMTNGGQFEKVETYNLNWDGYKVIDNVIVKGDIRVNSAYRINKYAELSSDHYPWVVNVTVI